jgi:hypothetical protein
VEWRSAPRAVAARIGREERAAVRTAGHPSPGTNLPCGTRQGGIRPGALLPPLSLAIAGLAILPVVGHRDQRPSP